MDWECCWNKKEVTAQECPSILEGEEELYSLYGRRVLEKCPECPRFAADLQRMREQGLPFADLLNTLVLELQDQRGRMHSMAGFINSKTSEINFLHELNLVLQSSLDLDEILSTALTAITAGKGFGMNRAFLLMTDRERHCLKGYLGMGPRNYEEAWQIWQEIDLNRVSLTAMARNFLRTKLSAEKAKFQDILENLTVSLDDHGHIFNRALNERKPLLVNDAFHNPDVSSELAKILGVDCFLVMPLISRNRRIGVIVADNCITHKRITPTDMQSLEIFAFPVAFALERASLYERVQDDLEKLTDANRKLKEQRDIIVRMEQMALVGRITSSIAHSIRNPLLVIGGFARSLLKNVEKEDSKREYLETILREAKQLEDVLDEVLNYSDSLYPAKDLWDVNLLVEEVYRELLPEMERVGISFSMELSPGLPMAHVDYRQIAFCLRTILGNSMGEPSAGARLQVETTMGEDCVVVTITDSSMDISAEPMEKLTAPFSSTRELGVGTPLALCKRILDKHGLPFDIENALGGGVKYVLRLPCRKEETLNG